MLEIIKRRKHDAQLYLSHDSGRSLEDMKRMNGEGYGAPPSSTKLQTDIDKGRRLALLYAD